MGPRRCSRDFVGQEEGRLPWASCCQLQRALQLAKQLILAQHQQLVLLEFALLHVQGVLHKRLLLLVMLRRKEGAGLPEKVLQLQLLTPSTCTIQQ